MPYDVRSCNACDTQARSSSSLHIRDNRNWDQEDQEEDLDRKKPSIKAVISFCVLIEDVGDKQHLKLAHTTKVINSINFRNAALLWNPLVNGVN